MSLRLHAGFAEAEFTPAPGLALFGQMHERRGERVRDPLMVCASAFSSPGSPDSAVVLASVDVCLLENSFVRNVQRRFQSSTGIPGARLLLHSTHTHVAPATLTLMAGSADAEFLEHLSRKILEAAAASLSRLEPVDLYAGTGELEHMGWNRRAMFSDGSSRMYGDASQPGFIGLEGPRDPALPVVFARGSDAEIKGVLISYATHPNAIENDSVYSADIPGEVRQRLARAIGGSAVVVYLTGAAGNTAPSLMDPPANPQPWRGEEGLRRSGMFAAGEALKVIAGSLDPMQDPVLRLEQRELRIPLRRWPYFHDPDYPQPLLLDEWPDARAYYAQAEKEWADRTRTLSPFEVRLSVLRLGEAAICTNPCELFVEYGLALRRTSPARVTLVAELTDGYAGYVPTGLAFERGGYETWCAPTSQLTHEAGEEIRSATAGMLRQAFEPASTPR